MGVDQELAQKTAQRTCESTHQNLLCSVTVPVQPKQSQMLTMNATVVTVWLDSWGDGGCGILYFAIEYKPSRQSSWTMSANHVKPTERIYSIQDLLPATEYQLKITAHNNAGDTEAVYNFTTLTLLGELQPPVSHSGDHPFYTNAKVFVPITLSILVLVLLIATLFWRKKIRRERGEPGRPIGESPSMAQMQNKHNRDQQYLAVRVGRGGQPGPLAVEDAYKAESADYIEDICPYATFQLSKPTYSESSYSGNVYSGPYHSVRGSFVYHDVKPPPIDKFKLGHEYYVDMITAKQGRTNGLPCLNASASAYKISANRSSGQSRAQNKEPEYTKVRRKGGRLRDPHSESQESDNLGSTDSEVKKILTLHLPISEYDTLGSDSEGDGRATSQELMSFSHRMRAQTTNSIISSTIREKPQRFETIRVSLGYFNPFRPKTPLPEFHGHHRKGHVLNFKNTSLSNFSVANSSSYEALKSDVPGVAFSAETVEKLQSISLVYPLFARLHLIDNSQTYLNCFTLSSGVRGGGRLKGWLPPPESRWDLLGWSRVSPDSLTLSGAEGSSSSSEASPPSGSVGRKPFQSRKGKAKATPLNKRHVRSSSGYSSHNEETTFSISHAPSFNERIHPPTRFSDLNPRELSEPDYEKGHKPRAMSKLSREAFQINV
ncbi:hypothetical protein NQ318_003981 [Aromia moschata]|uniref:Fibronectin type-III domain-containing protein n=1 Tax=Aromia moschata TaxID=1265417 RepID=A0AAV8Z9E8_9CUCU|nr:hypothetical protein NQ318_003981 [Aromia moschata]